MLTFTRPIISMMMIYYRQVPQLFLGGQSVYHQVSDPVHAFYRRELCPHSTMDHGTVLQRRFVPSVTTTIIIGLSCFKETSLVLLPVTGVLS